MVKVYNTMPKTNVCLTVFSKLFVQYFICDVVKYLRFVIEVHLNDNVITDINIDLEGSLCHVL